MDILISWLVCERDQVKQNQIINRTLQEPSLMECKNIMVKHELTGVYAKLYDCYINNKLHKMIRMLKFLRIYRKMAIVKGQLCEWILKIA